MIDMELFRKELLYAMPHPPNKDFNVDHIDEYSTILWFHYCSIECTDITQTAFFKYNEHKV